MSTTIKVLKDTPFDKAGTKLSASDFRLRYSYLVNPYNSDDFLVNYLTKGYKSDSHDVDLSQWFEVVQNQFQLNDWVWHQGLKRAFMVTTLGFTDMWPNHISLQAATSNPLMYNRFATESEIDLYSLVAICNGEVLIGRYRCYKKSHVWIELNGIESVVEDYVRRVNKFPRISEQDAARHFENSYAVTLNGLKVGCKEISHREVELAAKRLGLIPITSKLMA